LPKALCIFDRLF